MLSLNEVSKRYSLRGNTVIALDNANIDIPNGDFVSVIGRSGSGKSTLLSILGGMLSPCSGEVLLDQEALYELSPDQRARVRKEKIGFVFQTFNLVPYLSALENIQVPLLLAGKDKTEQIDRATALLGRMGLGDRMDHKPAELSIGQQQRVALARTLANDPSIVLADEPTGNLDPETGELILDFLEQLNADGCTIVMVTHDPAAAGRAKRSTRLVDGRIDPD